VVRQQDLADDPHFPDLWLRIFIKKLAPEDRAALLEY
jgi:hypothetical protein